MNVIVKNIFLFFVFAIPSLCEAGLLIGLGGQTWPFMWKSTVPYEKQELLSAAEKIKWSVSEKNLDQIKALGANWNFVDVWQEQDNGSYLDRIDRVISEHEKRGLKVVLRLLETPETYDLLLSKPDPKYGYSKKYYDWIKSIADRFGGRVMSVMISNEVDHDIGYNRIVYKPFRRITNNEYQKLIRTAKKAIHGSIKFMDAGLSSYSLCVAIISDLYDKKGLDAALEFWRSMRYDLEQKKRTAYRLLKLIHSRESARRVEFVNAYFDSPPEYDYFQLHHYFGSSSIQQVIDWVNRKIGRHGVQKEIIVGEFGYRMPVKKGETWDGRVRNVADWSRFNEQDQANDLVKAVTMFAKNRINTMLYWKIRFHNSKDSTGTLYKASKDGDDFKPFKAAVAFKNMVDNLSGYYIAANNVCPLTINSRFECASFSLRAGNPPFVSIIWSNSNEVINAFIKSKVVPLSVFDIYGAPEPLRKNKLTIGFSPVYITWH